MKNMSLARKNWLLPVSLFNLEKRMKWIPNHRTRVCVWKIQKQGEKILVLYMKNLK